MLSEDEDIKSDIPVFVLNQLKSIAQKQNFINFSIEKLCASDGFISSLSRYKIHGQRKDNQSSAPESLAVICKTLPTNKNRMKMFNNVDAFEREVYFYNKILPVLETFQKKRLTNYEKDGFVAYPKCYVATRIDNQIIIILEDLKTSGYVTWNRDNNLSIETVSMIMKELGKFHALSFALRDQCPEIMEEFTNDMNDMIVLMFNDFYGKITRQAFNVAIEIVDDPVALSVLTELREIFIQLMEDILRKNKSGAFGVIGHGDFYENNILFRFEHNVVTSVNVLDFQLSRIGSPAFDISYYLLTSTNSIIRQNYDELLQIYHQSLQSLLLKLGSDPNQLFNFNDLVNQMTKFGKYGVVFVPFLLQITLSQPDDVINLDNIESEEEMLNLIKLSDETKENYKKGLHSAVADAIRFGWIKPVEM